MTLQRDRAELVPQNQAMKGEDSDMRAQLRDEVEKRCPPPALCEQTGDLCGQDSRGGKGPGGDTGSGTQLKLGCPGAAQGGGLRMGSLCSGDSDASLGVEGPFCLPCSLPSAPRSRSL